MDWSVRLVSSFMGLRDLAPHPSCLIRQALAALVENSDGEDDTVMAHHRRTRNRSDE